MLAQNFSLSNKNNAIFSGDTGVLGSGVCADVEEGR